MTMTQTQTQKEFENSENEIKYTAKKYVRNKERAQIFRKQQKVYKNLFSMTLTSDYIVSSCKDSEYVKLTTDLKRIKNILAHSDDARLRAMATAQQKIISKKLKKYNAEREHLYRILKIYRDVTHQNDATTTKLKELMLMTYHIPVSVFFKNKKNKKYEITIGYIPKSCSMSRFSDETIDRMQHDTTKTIRNRNGELLNQNIMS